MDMEFIVLGSGTSIPLSDRASPSMALMVDEQTLVFDMGPGSVRQLAKAGLDFERVDHIFITHFHPDHTADLIHFLFASRTPSIITRRRPFTISGPAGIKELVRNLQGAYGEWLSLPANVMTVEEFEVGKSIRRDYAGFRIITSPTNHTPHSLAYRVESLSGKAVVYSGDTGFCHELVELANGADLLVLECAFPDQMAVEGHLTPSQAGRIATLAKAKQLLLIHFYPECLETNIPEQCRKTYQGKLTLGTDHLRIRV